MYIHTHTHYYVIVCHSMSKNKLKKIIFCAFLALQTIQKTRDNARDKILSFLMHLTIRGLNGVHTRLVLDALSCSLNKLIAKRILQG